MSRIPATLTIKEAVVRSTARVTATGTAPATGTGGSAGSGVGSTTGTNGVTLATNRTVDFHGASIGVPVGWSWEFRTQSGSVMGTAIGRDVSFTFPSAGTFVVSMTVTDDTETVTVTKNVVVV